MKNQNGFTLIELMIVIAIMGILASIAIPAYQDYVVRARVTEGITMAIGATSAVAETAMMQNALPANQAATGYTSPPATANVESIKIADKTGDVIIAYTALAGGGTIIYTPTHTEEGEVTWVCSNGSLASKYRPISCR